MRNCNTIILIAFAFLTSFKSSTAQEAIGESKSAIIAQLTKSTFKIIKNTDEKIMAEFPDPKMYYEYYFENNICYRYEGLIPESERAYYVAEMKRNGWIKSYTDGNKESYTRGKFGLKIITLTNGIGFFKFQIDKL